MKQFPLTLLCGLLALFPLFSYSYSNGDFGSTTGNWSNAASWNKWNGASWVAAGAVPGNLTTVWILNGTTMTLNATGKCKNLTIEANGQLYTGGSTPFTLTVNGSFITDSGTIGNPGSTDGIVFSIEGSSCTISGPGKFEAYQIMKSTAGNATNLAISMNIKLTCNQTAPTPDIYNNAANAFNVNFAANTIDSLWSYGASPVGNLSISGVAGNSTIAWGTFTVNGTLVIADTLYLTSANTTSGDKDSLIIYGTVQTYYINNNYSASGGFNLTMYGNSLLDILGTPGWGSFKPSPMWPSHNTFSFTNNTIEYGGLGNQIIDTSIAYFSNPPGGYRSLILGGSGTKTFNGNTLLVAQNLLIQNSVTLSAATNIHIQGNWTDQGTFSGAGSTVTFNADLDSTQVLIDTNGENFYNLIVNQSFSFYKLVLNNASRMNITNSLTLTSGIVMTDTTGSGSNYVLLDSSAGVSGASDSSFVYGRVEKYGSSPFTYPVGKGSRYRPITVGTLSATDTVAVEYFHLNPYYGIPTPYDTSQKTPPIDHVSGNEYWTIWSSGITTPDSIVLSWDTAYSGGVTNTASLVVAEDSLGNTAASTTWITLGNGGTTGTISDGTIMSLLPLTLPVYANRASFTLGSNDPRPANPLPVSMLAFTATESGQDVLLQWITASEINNDYFTIERAASPNTSEEAEWKFTAIGNVKGSGNATIERSYQFTDSTPLTIGKRLGDGPNGILLYYRLKQTDFDGHYTYSNVVAVDFSSVATSVIKLFPNPASGNVSIGITWDNTHKTGLNTKTYMLRVFDMNGSEVMPQRNIDFSYGMLQSLDVTKLPKGMYILQLSNENDVQQSALVKN